MQSSFSLIVLIGLMVATLLTVFIGLAVMVKGGKISAKHSNTLMRVRIALQAACLVAFAIYFFAR
jgi:uncharacterized BrkB/YihY/UPF0761 family membrane protein